MVFAKTRRMSWSGKGYREIQVQTDIDLSFESDATSGQYSALRIRSGGVLSIQHGATNREMFGTGAVTPPNNVITVDTGGTIRKSAGTAISNIRPRVLLSGSFDVLSGTINVQGTCSMSGSKTGSGQLTGNCGTF